MSMSIVDDGKVDVEASVVVVDDVVEPTTVELVDDEVVVVLATVVDVVVVGTTVDDVVEVGVAVEDVVDVDNVVVVGMIVDDVVEVGIAVEDVVDVDDVVVVGAPVDEVVDVGVTVDDVVVLGPIVDDVVVVGSTVEEVVVVGATVDEVVVVGSTVELVVVVGSTVDVVLVVGSWVEDDDDVVVDVDVVEVVGAVTRKAGDSSDVLPAGSVAVAVTKLSMSTVTGSSMRKSAWPAPSVRTFAVPSGLSPSPLPDGSALVLAKSSTRYCVSAAASSVPVSSVVSPRSVTPVTSGKFCSAFAPSSSSSPASLSVTPSFSRSMPRPPFEKIRFSRMSTPVGETNVIGLVANPDTTMMPSPVLCAITLP